MGVKRSVLKFIKKITDPKTYFKGLIRQKRTQWLHKMAGLCDQRSFYVQSRMVIDQRSIFHAQDFSNYCGGFFLRDDAVERHVIDVEAWDMVRRDMIILLLRTLNERHIEGDLVELGVYKGLTARLMHHYMPDRVLHLFDTFKGFDLKDVQSELKKTGLYLKTSHFSDTSVETVLKRIQPKNDNIRIHQGFFPETIPSDWNDKKFAFVHLDADLYDPTLEGLKFFYPRLAVGGCLLVHDYNAWPGARRAVDEYFANRQQFLVPMPDTSGSVLIVKSSVNKEY